MEHIKTFEFFHFGSKKINPKAKVDEIVSELRRNGYYFTKGSNLYAFISFSSSNEESSRDQDVWVYRSSVTIYIHPKYDEKRIKVGSVGTAEYIDIDLNDTTINIIKQITDYIRDTKNKYYKKHF